MFMQNLIVSRFFLFALISMFWMGTAFAEDPETGVENLSDLETTFTGAQVLSKSKGEVGSGPLCDYDAQTGTVCGEGVGEGYWGGDADGEFTQYAQWEGDSLFFGVDGTESGNKVSATAEFYWLESSTQSDNGKSAGIKESDLYVIVLKVASAPNLPDWKLAQEKGLSDEVFHPGAEEICQYVGITMKDSEHGSIRWDFSIPNSSYSSEPMAIQEISQEYSVGYEKSASAEASASGDVLGIFTEGTKFEDVKSKVSIGGQSKGTTNEKFSVKTKYSITLYAWHVFVTPGAQKMEWKLMADQPLEGGDGEELDPAINTAYHEYFIVIQSDQRGDVKLDNIDVGGNFRKKSTLWFCDWCWSDDFQRLSVEVRDIHFKPPTDVQCYANEEPPPNVCSDQKGVCAAAIPVCHLGKWVCAMPNIVAEKHEVVETKCDGLDNDCDGAVDTNLSKECETKCGKGYQTCTAGKWGGCSSGDQTTEICDGIDNDCDGKIDETLKRSCQNQCGNGQEACDFGVWVGCNAPAVGTEICDGGDNDCDGQVDEELIRTCATACGTGNEFCSYGEWVGCDAVQPQTEICDGVDNDCDGYVDEGLVCDGSGQVPIAPINTTPTDPNATTNGPSVTVEAPSRCSSTPSEPYAPGAWVLSLLALVLLRRRNTVGLEA